MKKFIANPINSFLLIKLLTQDIERLFTHIEVNYEIESTFFLALSFIFYKCFIRNNVFLIEYLQELKKKYYLPSVEDYTGVIDSIYRLQKIYKVDIGIKLEIWVKIILLENWSVCCCCFYHNIKLNLNIFVLSFWLCWYWKTCLYI